jgi:hypothetical protein
MGCSHGPSVLPFIPCVWHDGVVEDVGNFGLLSVLHVHHGKNSLHLFGIPLVAVNARWVLAEEGFVAATASEAFDSDGSNTVHVTVSALVRAAFSGAGLFVVWAWGAYAGLGGGLGHRKRRLSPAFSGSTHFYPCLAVRAFKSNCMANDGSFAAIHVTRVFGHQGPKSLDWV